MKINKALLATAALVSLSAAMPASAATLVYNFTASSPQATSFSFSLDNTAAPISVNSDSFVHSISSFKQNGTADNTVTAAEFYDQAFGGGLIVSGNTLYGQPLYSGTLASPTLLTGNFTLFSTSAQTNAVGTLNVMAAAVPEPATWAMMLVGFGMMGASMRYRRRSTKAALA